MAKRKKARTKSSTLASKAFEQEPDDIELEDQAEAAERVFQDHMILLYGPPKIGKSTLMSKLKGVYFLPTEPGYLNLKVRKTPIRNWVTFTAFIEKVEKRKKFLKTVVFFCVDTVDNLSKFCMQYVCGREGIAHPSDQEWGKGWEAYRDEFTHWILRLGTLGPGLSFISHETEREIVSRNMKITRVTPAMPKTCYTVVNNMADIILRMGYTTKRKSGKHKGEYKVTGTRTETRCLLTKPSELYDAGDRTGLLPREIIFKTEKEAVKKLIKCFDG